MQVTCVSSHLRLIVGHFKLERLESNLQYLEGGFYFSQNIAFARIRQVNKGVVVDIPPFCRSEDGKRPCL